MSFRGFWTTVLILYDLLRQLFELLGLKSVFDYIEDVLNDVDIWFANSFTSLWDRNLERIATAPMKIISDTFVEPDENIKIDRQKIGHRTIMTPIECWLTDESIDYSIFFDYYIDPNKAKDALSRILAKTPIIGGVWQQVDDKQICIDHSNPRIPFIHAQTDFVPSTQPKDAEQPYYYTKYTNGANKLMPFPKGKHVFKITMTHYPKHPKCDEQDNDNDVQKEREEEEEDIQNGHGADNKQDNEKWNTLIAVGCSHALCDAEGLFTLLRGWASELRGVGDKEYKIPTFDREKLFIKKDEIKPFDSSKIVLGKHFGHSTVRNSWFGQALWPARRWRPRTWIWSKTQINALKQVALNGKAGQKLKEIAKGRISGNDVLLALHWKLNAVLNKGYEYNRPIMCTMVINTRKWIPDRFPKGVNYFGNGLAFLVLHEQRGKLIEMDFSEIVWKIRETVMKLKSQDFEDDLQFYTQWIDQNPVKYRQKFQGRWAVGPGKDEEDVYGGYFHSHYLHDRDMMVSNLMKLNTHEMNMGQGDPIIVRFNHRDEPTMMTYIFKYPTEKNDQFEFYGAFPREYDEFFEKYDIQDPKLNWKEIEENYVKYPVIRPYIRGYPCCRGIRIYPKRDCCSKRRDKKANFAFVEL